MIVLKRYDYTVQLLLPFLALKKDILNFGKTPKPGDLILLGGVVDHSPWHLSFYESTTKHPAGDEYLLSSLKTGAMASWSNCTLHPFKREWTDQFPKIRWTDELYMFEEKLGQCARYILNYKVRVRSFSGAFVNIELQNRYAPSEVHQCPTITTRCTPRTLRSFLNNQIKVAESNAAVSRASGSQCGTVQQASHHLSGEVPKVYSR